MHFYLSFFSLIMLVPLGFSNIPNNFFLFFFFYSDISQNSFLASDPTISFPPLSITHFLWFVSQLTITKEKFNVQITSLLKPSCISLFLL